MNRRIAKKIAARKGVGYNPNQRKVAKIRMGLSEGPKHLQDKSNDYGWEASGQPRKVNLVVGNTVYEDARIVSISHASGIGENGEIVMTSEPILPTAKMARTSNGTKPITTMPKTRSELMNLTAAQLRELAKLFLGLSMTTAKKAELIEALGKTLDEFVVKTPN